MVDDVDGEGPAAAAASVAAAENEEEDDGIVAGLTEGCSGADTVTIC